MVTMMDVAKAAGVSRPTVSVVLNGKSTTLRVSEKTKQHVLATAKRLGYTTDDLARAVKTGKSKVIGLVSNSGSVELQQGLTTAAEPQGYSAMMFSVSRDRSIPIKQRMKSLVETIKIHRLPGVIIHYSHPAVDLLLEYLADNDIPSIITCIAGEKTDRAVHYISDDAQSGQLAARHFLECGYKNFTCVYDYNSYSECVRAENFTRTIEERGFTVKQNSTVAEMPVRATDFVRTLGCKKGIPHAIFCAVDMRAVKVMTGVMSAGLRVPEDVAIVAHGNILITKMTIPQLSTIDDGLFNRARVACSALIESIKNGIPLTDRKFNVSLIIRGSSKTDA